MDHEKLKKFVEISGDHNPLHTDEAYAKSKGYPSEVVHGLLSSSLYSSLVGLYLPGKYALLHSINISFEKPVFCGDELTVAGEVTYINEAYQQIEIKASITNQNHVRVSSAKIKAGLLHE